MRRPVDQKQVRAYQHCLTDRQNERLAKIQKQLRHVEQVWADRGAFHLNDRNGNVIPHRNE